MIDRTTFRLFVPLLLLAVVLGCQMPPSSGPSLSRSTSDTPPAATSPTADDSQLAPGQHSSVTANDDPPLTQVAEATSTLMAASPTAEPTLRPTATPTVAQIPGTGSLHHQGPPQIVATADQAAADGDYARAIALYKEAIATAEASRRPPLQLALARSYMADERHHDAIAVLADLVSAQDIPPEIAAEALGLLGTSYEALREWQAAIEAYRRYLDLEPTAAAHVRWRMAKAYRALEQYVEAEQQLVAIRLSDLSAARQAEILEALAEARLAQGNNDGALEAYDRILGFAQRADYRALIHQRKAAVLRGAGRIEESEALFAQVINEAPTSAAAYLALQALDEMGTARVSDLQRGEVLYHAGQPALALDALRRYVVTTPAGAVARAYYFIGLAHARLQQYAEAFQAYDIVIEQHAQDPMAPEAWMAKARAAAAYGGDPSGLYHEFVVRYPHHRSAPAALWAGAVALERQGAWDRAAAFYQRLYRDYPTDSGASEARFREGLAAYALSDMTRAAEIWRGLLQTDPPIEERVRVLVWLGLASRHMGDRAQADTYWRQAVAVSPRSYYGLRARDLMAGVTPHLPPDVATDIALERLQAADWATIANWITRWAPAAEDATNVAQDPSARRGTALVRLGWHHEAIEVYRSLRDRLKDDAAGLLELARLADSQAMYSISISCAERLLRLGQDAGAGEPPQALLRLAYPAYYGHLVGAECERRAVDPLLFLALLRQESRFDPQAVSYAGASGLAQVMPDTGTWIASRIGTPDYRHALLFRPMISVQYGVWFIAQLLDMYQRDWIAALVAYNAGPGNLSRWTGGQPITDHDFFYETLPNKQPQDYVRLIYQFYDMYREIYH